MSAKKYQSPFTDKWRREAFAALVAHPYSTNCVDYLCNVAGTHAGRADNWAASLDILAFEIDNARVARGRA